jgi:hypothetical protein
MLLDLKHILNRAVREESLFVQQMCFQQLSFSQSSEVNLAKVQTLYIWGSQMVGCDPKVCRQNFEKG